MSFKITGLGDLQREMQLLADFAEALDGNIATLSFNPLTRPASNGPSPT
jgi:hypothetical protein